MSSNNDADSAQKRLGYGLTTQAETPVPLKEINVEINIQGFVAEVTSTLLYSNCEENPVEAEFTFPVDDGSAVFKFEAEIEKRRIVAEIQEKEQAKLTYQDAIDKGSTAMLLKEDDTAEDIFQCTLGNLPPKTDAKIIFSYVIELPQEPDGKIKFTLPTVLNPRYSPALGGGMAAEGATYSAPAEIPYNFSMTGSIRGYHKVLSVTSVQDKLKVEKQGDKTVGISLAEDFKFDHDLSFLVEYENCYTPQVILEMGNPSAESIMKEDLLMVNFFPNLEGDTTSGEYIFVIDCSDSMSGSRMKNAKEALFLFLKSLPRDCFFNIISFGSSYSSLFESGSVEYNEENLKTALDHQTEIDGSGTEIYEPLKFVFTQPLISGHPRQLILLTDGEVSNTTQVIALAKSNSHNARVFTLGIGSGASSSLIKGVALASNGKSEFIQSNLDQIQSKVISLLKSATKPAVSDLEIKWNLPKGVTAVPIPSQPPTFIGAGDRLCLYTLLTGGKLKSSTESCSVKLSGKCDGKPVDFKMEFSVPTELEMSESAPLHRLAAKTQIKILEIEESNLANEDFNHNNENIKEIRRKLVLVSKSANIVSKMTAFVAVDKNKHKLVKGTMEKRHCPVPVATKEFSKALAKGESSTESCSVKLSGKCDGKPVDFKMEFSVPTELEMSESAPLHRLAAKTQIKILEMEESNLANEDFNHNNENIKEIRRKLVLGVASQRNKKDTGIFTGLLSEMSKHETMTYACESPGISFFEARPHSGVDYYDARPHSAVNYYEVPNPCYGAREEACRSFPVQDGRSTVARSSPERFSTKNCRRLSDSDDDSCWFDAETGCKEEKVCSREGRPRDRLLDLIRLQEIDGHWELTTELMKLLQIVSEEDFKNSLDFVKDTKMAATIAVVLLLRSEFISQHDQWEMIETKALKWLTEHLEKDKKLEELIERAEHRLSSTNL